jgi:tetratricopeptide (TPR) repeat protein
MNRHFSSWLLGGFAVAVVLATGVCFAQTAGEGSDEDALSAYTMGVFLLEKGQPQKAVPHLERAWQSSRDERIGNKLCEAYFRTGDLKSCEEIIAVLLESNERNDVALLFRARINYFQGREETALEDLQQLRSMSNPSFDVERLMARIQLELGRYEEALLSYENAVRLDPSYPVIHYRLGILLRRFDREAEAERELRLAIQLQPLFSEAVMELAELLVEDERFDDAEVAIRALLDEGDDSYNSLVTLTNLYAQRGKYEEAIQLLEDRQQSGRLPREGVLLLGRLYYDNEDYGSSLKLFQSIFDEGSHTPELARVLGELSLRAGQADEALGYYRDAIELDPDDYRNHIALFFASTERFNDDGSDLIALSDDEKSEILERAAAVVPEDDFDGLYLMGVCYESLDRYEPARRFFGRALEVQPDSERALLNLAGALERLGRYDEAEPILVRLHERKPEDPRICNFYGYLLALMNTRLDEAERLVRTALKHDSENGYYLDSLGWVYFKRGEYERAVVELERASRLVGDDPVILEHLGDAYRSLERFRDALAAYERSKNLQGENTEILDKIDAARDQLGN